MHSKKTTEGTHRTQSPKETLKKISPFLKKMGITRVANVTGLDKINIPVFTAYRPNSKSLAVSQGKGYSDDAARVSALMESIEGYHAENIDLPITTQSYYNLKTLNINVIDPDQLPKLIDKDYESHMAIPWVECFSIKDHKSILFPYEAIHTNFTLPMKTDSGFFIADSNGLSSGNTMIEAINHGLYEVIERDCLALWQLTPPDVQNTKRIDLNTIDTTYIKDNLEKLQDKKIEIAVWDITSDINIPTFICKILSSEHDFVRPALGSGTHLDKNVALSRAITEAAQSRLTFIAGARDDQYQDLYSSQSSEDTHDEWRAQMEPCATSIDFQSIDTLHNSCLQQDQSIIFDRLDHVGITNAYYADLTKKRFSIPVVKVVIPGLEGVSHPGKRILGERGLDFYHKYGVGACEMEL